MNKNDFAKNKKSVLRKNASNKRNSNGWPNKPKNWKTAWNDSP